MFVYALIKKNKKSKTKRQNDVNYSEFQEPSGAYKMETTRAFADEELNNESQFEEIRSFAPHESSYPEESDSIKSIVTSRDRYIMTMCAISMLSFSFISSMMTLVNLTFSEKYPVIFDSALRTRIMNSILIGELIGMLFFGLIFRFIDKLTMSIISSAISFIATVIATASTGSTTQRMFWMISICLGASGFGLGGQMVSAATLLIKAVNNYKNAKKRARFFILCSNLPLVSGLFISCLVYFVTWRATGQGKHLATSWRVVFGISAIFPFITLISSLIMKFTFKGYEGEKPYWVPLRITTYYYRKRLLVTCFAWFIYGFVYFPNIPYIGIVTQFVFSTPTIDSTAQWSLLTSALSIPGVFLGYHFISWFRQKNVILFGFASYFVIGLVIGCGYSALLKITALFTVFYGLFKSFGNIGPGNLSIFYSCDLYADCIRGLFFSVSAASGIVGSIVGFNIYEPIIDHIGIRWFYIISSLISIIGIVTSFLFLPRVPEDDLDNENLAFEEYLTSIKN
ncbi:transporter activity protein [[Candida] boidinii]|nr:transporter activity protein [[Candida] boidinii]